MSAVNIDSPPTHLEDKLPCRAVRPSLEVFAVVNPNHALFCTPPTPPTFPSSDLDASVRAGGGSGDGAGAGHGDTDPGPGRPAYAGRRRQVRESGRWGGGDARRG
jgi:hypothetical protein